MSTIIREVMNHPKAGAIGVVLALSSAGVGYLWASSQHQQLATKVEVTALKSEIVSEVDDLITLRDIKQTERAIEKLTTRINLGTCATVDCAIEKAERENNKQYIESLRADRKERLEAK